MNDEELTALAAKAYGNALAGFSPLTDDGDALRLAVKLRIDLHLWIRSDQVSAHNHAGDNWISLNGPTKPSPQRQHSEPRGDDEYAATRRAITRAAAAIGMEGNV